MGNAIVRRDDMVWGPWVMRTARRGKRGRCSCRFLCRGGCMWPGGWKASVACTTVPFTAISPMHCSAVESYDQGVLGETTQQHSHSTSGGKKLVQVCRVPAHTCTWITERQAMTQVCLREGRWLVTPHSWGA